MIAASAIIARWFGQTGFAAEKTYTADPGPCAVEVAYFEWNDAARRRPVPAKCYFPKTGEGPFPVIIFSHGLGGNRDGYEYLGRHWASYGYVSVHLTHKGSDDEVWRGKANPMQAMRAAAADPKNAVNRPLDVRFAIDQVEKLQREESPLKGRLDLKHIGVAGHSFGAYTALAAAGMVFPIAGRNLTLSDPRLSAAIAMSAPVAKQREQWDTIYGGIRIPILHMTGTRDDSPIGDSTAADRRIPYDHIRGADQFLLTFADGDHMVFSGRPRLAPGGEHDALYQQFICMATTAFWDAYLRNDAAARIWLTTGPLATALGANAAWEQHLK